MNVFLSTLKSMPMLLRRNTTSALCCRARRMERRPISVCQRCLLQSVRLQFPTACWNTRRHVICIGVSLVRFAFLTISARRGSAS